MTRREGSGARILVARGILTLDPSRPRAHAVAIRDGRILVAGSVEDARAALPAGSAESDLGDAVLLPGFHDAHTHLSAGAVELAALDLRDARGVAEVASRVSRAAAALPAGAWVRGFGWDETRFPEGSRPSRASLDEASPHHPVFLGRADGHAAWLNTRALAEVGADVTEPHGLLVEEAAERARAHLPPVSDRERRRALVRALAEARRLGLTSLEDVIEPWALPLYAALRDEGALPVRVGLWLPLDLEEGEARRCRERIPPSHPRLHCAVRKTFLDGTLSARTAALLAPYADLPASAGRLRPPSDALRASASAAARDGWAIAFHAVGDLAVRTALDWIEDLPPAASGRRHRIEHAQVVAEEDLPRFAACRAVASLQPAHWLADRNLVGSRLGGRRGVLVHPWRRLAAAGADLAFGSDWPVAPLDPRVGLAAAIGEEREDERLDLARALLAHTAGPARAAGDPLRGVIREGSRADLVAVRFDEKPGLGVPQDWKVLATWVDGED